MTDRRYPVGIQTFSRIIEEGYVYIDKTDLVWNLTRVSPYVFLSRPRRFGKSLLSSTLESYFLGNRELFKGLKIESLEKEWRTYPVIRLDLSVAKGQEDALALRSCLKLQFSEYVGKYGRDEAEETPGQMLRGLITRAYEKTGSQVVVLIDEYDAPLLDVLHDGEALASMRRVMQEFYAPLKACERYIKFCFITGITKFSQLSIFSTLNNLTNVSMSPEFAGICGITEDEFSELLEEDIAALAVTYGIGAEEMKARLKDRYDGYHFSEAPEGVYNPFSLLKCFLMRKMSNYWFESGTPTFLIKQMHLFQTDITGLDEINVPAAAFDQPTENMLDALPLLYQTGYLTIKEYDRDTEFYRLSIPNQEVRVGLTEGLLPYYSGLSAADVQVGFAARFWRALKVKDINLALEEMRTYLAGVPYVEGFKKKLAEAATAEGFYEYTFYLIFSMLNVYVRTQVKCAGGRIDLVVWMPGTTYVFELKTSGSAREALAQIDTREYAIPFAKEGAPVVKVGIKIDVNTRTLEDWVVA